MSLLSSALAIRIVIVLLVSASVPSLTASLGSSEETLIDRLAAEEEKASKQAHDAAAAGLQLKARADDSPPEGSNATIATPLGAPPSRHPGNGDLVFYVIIGTTTGLGLTLIVICAICWFKYNSVAKQADDEYVEADFTLPPTGHPGDGKLALSAQMYHYQHQKQQMMALEKSNGESKHGASDVDSDMDNEDADYTVYECPGLAPTGEMEVRNPLFKEEFESSAPAASSAPKPAGPAHPASSE